MKLRYCHVNQGRICGMVIKSISNCIVVARCCVAVTPTWRISRSCAILSSNRTVCTVRTKCVTRSTNGLQPNLDSQLAMITRSSAQYLLVAQSSLSAFAEKHPWQIAGTISCKFWLVRCILQVRRPSTHCSPGMIRTTPADLC